MRATMKRQKAEPDFQFSMPLLNTAHPGVTTQSALPTMQNRQDELAASIGALAPEEEAPKTNYINANISSTRLRTYP